jgi:hypothetical protein
MFNAGETKEKFAVPANAKYTDLLSGKKITGTELSLEPLTAVVLKRSK